ncbi:MAG: 3-hydroxyacyl-CoA dehydrogenase family protein [Deltaproteobacteria bacterium]|nr:3-hydroxyacyl-CoA dehydrogenase family protein [Deltaproteobacteria bacterium]
MRSEDIKKTIVVGAGVMGNSIALSFAKAGIEVALVDVNKKTLDRALKLIRSSLNTLADHGSIAGDEIPSIIDRIQVSTDLESSAQNVDFAMEVVVEVEDVKKKVFSELAGLIPEDAIIASNTSGLDVFSFAEIKRPERLVVAHWFAPAHIIPLVEVVPGPKTAPEAVQVTADLMKRLGKKPVVMKEFVRSFIVNRIQNYMAIAYFEILENGWATAEDIDQAVKTSLGIRLPIVGVVQNMDFTGLDLVLDVMKSHGVNNTFIEQKVKRGHLGAKTSKGVYDYNGRSEEEILNKRDRLYLSVLDHLEDMNAFQPV